MLVRFWFVNAESALLMFEQEVRQIQNLRPLLCSDRSLLHGGKGWLKEVRGCHGCNALLTVAEAAQLNNFEPEAHAE